MTTRIEPCEPCEGSGTRRYGHPNCPCDPSVWGCRCYDAECEDCDGTGEIEIEVEPVEEEDLMEPNTAIEPFPPEGARVVRCGHCQSEDQRVYARMVEGEARIVGIACPDCGLGSPAPNGIIRARRAVEQDA